MRFDVLNPSQNVLDNLAIEASAGTGKTFSIENLFVRILLETPSDVTPEHILVVTFTKAATRELRMRIRNRLEQAIIFLSSKESCEDPLAALLENYRGDWNVLSKLQDALFLFDESSIFTIHGFCSQMLKESGIASSLGLAMDADDALASPVLVEQIVRDFFRIGLDGSLCSPGQLTRLLNAHRGSVSELERHLVEMLQSPIAIGEAVPFQRQLAILNRGLGELKDLYAPIDHEREIDVFVAHAKNYKGLADRSGQVKEEFLQGVKHFLELVERGEISATDFDAQLARGFPYLTAFDPANLKTRAKQGHVYPEDSLYAQCQRILLPTIQASSSPTHIFAAVLSEAKRVVEEYLTAHEKYRFDDLLTQLRAKCEDPSFLQKIRERYRFVLVDEFQDTDPRQWDLFKTLFSTPHHRMILVGDPKQSIYAFRHADIYTYYDALQEVAPKGIASLETNWRSEQPLIESLNHLFLRSPSLLTLPKREEISSYHSVEAASAGQTPRLSDERRAVHFLSLPREEPLSLEEAEEHYFFPFLSREIDRLQREQEVRFSDWAVLVRDRFQANRVAQYLKQCGIPAMTQRSESLSESPALSAWIEAIRGILYWKDPNALKIFLGGRLVRYTSADLDRLFADQQAHVQLLADVDRLRNALLAHRYPVFFETLLHWVPPHRSTSLEEFLLGLEGGEPFLQECRQILSIALEEASMHRMNVEGLVRYLEHFRELSRGDEGRFKRKEDPTKDAVRIVTLHYSKGLEYPIVFPLGLINPTKAPDLLVPGAEKNQVSLYPIHSSEDPRYLAFCAELDAEKLRQLYVALTRAKWRIYFPLYFSSKKLKAATASPLQIFAAQYGREGFLSSPDLYAHMTPEGFAAFEEEMRSHPDRFSYECLDAASPPDLNVREEMSVPLQPPPVPVIPQKFRFLESFSRLMQKRGEIHVAHLPSPTDFHADKRTPHELPAGAETGLIAHTFFEKLSYTMVGSLGSSEELQPYLKPHLYDPRYEPWLDALASMVRSALCTPLSAGFALSEIPDSHMHREMEFLYPLREENGYIKGVIDLFFGHKGRYYLVDWKSNWLGPDQESYTPEAMRAAMEQHGYDLQAQLYREALKRYIARFDPRPFEEIYGGAYYIFVRGVSESTGILHVEGQS